MSTSKSKPIKLSFEQSSEPKKSFRLTVDTQSSMREAFVVDGNFKLVARGTGRFTKELPPGKYQLRSRSGNTSDEQWVVLDTHKEISLVQERDSSSSALSVQSLPQRAKFDANASLVITIFDRERKLPQATEVRIFDSRDKALKPTKVVSADGQVLTLSYTGLKAGSYRLLVQSKRFSSAEMCPWVADGHQTQIVLERCPIRRMRGVERKPHLGSTSINIFSRYASSEIQSDLWLMTEMAKSSLASQRNVIPLKEVREAVSEKALCPMLGLLGAHLLYRLWKSEAAVEWGTTDPRQFLSMIVDNLERLLPNCPDVLALKIALYPDTVAVFRMPPMLVDTWNLVATDATLKTIPRDSLSSRIGVSLTPIRPWLVWKILANETSVETESATPTSLVERGILKTNKTNRKIGQLAEQYSLPRSTVRKILKK